MNSLASRSHALRAPSAARQRGAVLYIALIMLLLLALIGIVGMQVASMQERMASNYRQTNLAFQSAEAGAREREALIESTVNTGAVYEPDKYDCGTFDPVNDWSVNVTADEAVHTRRLDQCFPGGGSSVMGTDQSESTGNVYQITAFGRDAATAAASTSFSVIDTIYVP